MDADYDPMDYEEQNADQPEGDDDSDELINEQADDDEDQDEADDSKETEEEEVLSGFELVQLRAPVAGTSRWLLLLCSLELRRMRPPWPKLEKQRRKGSSSSRCRRSSWLRR